MVYLSYIKMAYMPINMCVYIIDIYLQIFSMLLLLLSCFSRVRLCVTP